MGEHLQRIQFPSQLSSLSVWRLIPRKHSDRVVIEAEGTLALKARAWENQLSKLQNSCGCEQGAAGLIVGLAGYALYLLARPGGWGHPGKREFWIGLGVLTLTTTVGKFAGLFRAQRRLRRLITEIQQHWKPEPNQTGRPVTTGAQPSRRAWSTPCCAGQSTVSAKRSLP
jgi:hypothetical protein